MLGGTFQDFSNFDPVVSQIVTDQTPLNNEPLYDTSGWYPTVAGSLNRFLSIDGQSHERLIMVPGQYRANGPGASIGTERRYNSLDFAVYHAPFSATDFIAPSIWQVEAISTTIDLRFRVRVSDATGSIARVVMLYRRLTDHAWSKAELTYNPNDNWAEVRLPHIFAPIEYFAQAVDETGNVATVLDHGIPFTQVRFGAYVYLPVVRR